MKFFRFLISYSIYIKEKRMKANQNERNTSAEYASRIYGHSLKTVKQLQSFKDKDSVYCSFVRKRNEGFALFCQHVLAMLKKKYIFSKREILLTVPLILVLPVIMSLFTLVTEEQIIKSQIFSNDSIFSLKRFGRTTVVYGIDPNSNVTIYLGDTYASLLESEDLYLIDLDEKNYQTYLVEQAQKNLISYKTKYIIGAVFTEKFNVSVITAFYNPDAYHSAPTSLLYAHNTILKYFTKDSSFHFTVKIHPLPYKDTEGEVWSSDFELSESFLLAQNLMTGMAILMSSYIVLLVIEISTQSKKQQIINGLNAFVYWFATFIYDFGLYALTCILILMILSMFEAECLSRNADISALACLLMLHGLSALLFIYCCSFWFKSAPVAYGCIFLYYFIGLLLLCIIFRLELSNIYHVSEPLNILFTAFMPSYCVARGMYNIHRNCKSNFICNNNVTQSRCHYRNASMIACCLDQCGDFCLFWSKSHFSVSISGIGQQIIALIIQPIIFCVILVLFEMEILQNLRLHIKERQLIFYNKSLPRGDKTVEEETDKILTSPLPKLLDENNYLVLRSLSKLCTYFPVGELSFGVKKGDSFGLVGIDSSGKSTILKMICNSTPISTGSVYIDGYNILEYPNKVQDKIGFSLGNEALLKQFTVKETLTLYSHIRGIPEREIACVIETLTNILSLQSHMLIKNCNVINKRKLCVAIAIIGTPPLILLDEPTDDMDPESCVKTREAINYALGVGCTIIMTTSKIEESQALCNRIGILVKGKLTYIGNFDYLRRQYADGFSLILRVQKSRQTRGSRHVRQAINLKGNLEEIKGLIEDILPEAILKTQYTTFLNYYVPCKMILWSKLFSMLESLKRQDMLHNYTVCETSLEYVFAYYVACGDDFGDIEILEFLKARKKEKTIL